MTRRRPASTFPRLFISNMCDFVFFTWFMLIPWYYIFYDLPPEFAVQLTPVGRGLNMSALAASISPAFHVALRASNRRATERCYRDGEGAVSYAGFTIASGRVPSFCVPTKGSREVPFLAREDDGVGLPEHLRDRMAAAHSVGALELEVQVRLFQGGDASSGKPTRMWCKTTMGGGGAPPTEPKVTACTVLALQNWFDIEYAENK